QRDRLLELGDLVIKPADPGLFQLGSAQLVGPVNTDSPDALDGFLAVGQTAAPELLEGRPGGIDGGEYTEAPCPMSGRLAVADDGPVAHLGQDLLNHITDQIFSHLHGRYRCKEGPVLLMVSCRSEFAGRFQTQDSKWQMANGKWQMADGGWRMTKDGLQYEPGT